MAIYHTHISSGSRYDGQSAAVKVAYILREGAYGGRHDLVTSGSGNMPAWASTDPRRLFAAADLYERANGRLFVHVWVALPNELNAPQRHQLVLAIATALTEARLPYVYAIHAGDPKSEGEPANPHVHFVISERVNDGITRDERQWFKRANRRNPVAGGAAKDRSLKELTWVEDTRKRVEELTNEHLYRAGRKERVTADSHAKRIAVAEAEGDQETAEYLRRHPPGIHLGPAAAAMERNRYRGKQGEEPELARPGEPTERGNLARAKAVEKERTRGELERVSKDLCRAREEERCATASVALARSVWLSDAEILGVYKESESVEAGTGWVAITEAAALLVGRKDQAEAAAESFGIDVEAVVRGAHARDENAVAAVEQATGIFQEAQLALMTNEVIVRIQAEAGSSDSVSGWGAVAEAARTRLAWKARTEAAARKAGIGDIDDVYTAARSREEDPLSALEAATAEREHQGRIASAARAALLTDAAIARIRKEAEASEPGSGWAAVEAATAVQTARKKQAEAGAVAAGVFEIEAVYAGAWKWREDPVAALEEATAIFAEARAALLPDVEVWRIHDAAESAEPGTGWAAVKAASASRQAQKESAEAGATTFGLDIEGVYAGAQAGGADPVVALEEKVAEEERLASERRAAIEQREGSVAATKQGRTWLLAAQREALGSSGRQLTLEQREEIVETVYQRLDEALRDREAALRSNPQASQYLPEVVGGAERLSTLAEREKLIDTAERQLREQRRTKLFQHRDGESLYYGKLDELEPSWRQTGRALTKHIDAALDHAEGTLAARARQAAEERKRRFDAGLAALRERRCEDVSVGGEWFYTRKLEELERGQRQSSPERREQALAWAGRQMDRLDSLRAEDALDLFFRKLAKLGAAQRPEDIEGALDHAEEQLRKAAERRQDRINALSEDEQIFFDEKLDALEPSWRGTGTAQPANIDEALDYARTELEALDRDIERRRGDIHGTPGDGYDRLLRAGFESDESRQGKVQALTTIETYLNKAFDRQEEKIRTDEEGEAFVRRGRLDVLKVDRDPETLTERGRVIEQAKALQQAAVAERKRRAAEQRDARLKRVFAAPGGDEVFFAALDAQKPTWRQTGTRAVDVDSALDIAERNVDRRKTPAAAEHKVVVEAERKFPDTPSTAWRQAGERFQKGSTHARMSQRLADRTLVCALAAEREEPPASSALVQRLFTWLRAQIDRLLERLGLVQPVTRQTVPASGAAEPAQPVSAAPTTPSSGTPSRSVGGQATPATDKAGHPQVATGHRTNAEEARRKSVSDREFAICTVPGGRDRLRTEEDKIRSGSNRPLSLEERESVASTVDAWIRTGVRADVERVIGETRAAVGFAPPVQIWREVGHQLHQEREYIPGSRPGLLISTLRTLPDGTADVPTDEEQTLMGALDEQRRAEAEGRHQKALKVYRRNLQTWKDSGSLFRPRGWSKPTKPSKPEPEPVTQEQVKKFRQELIYKITRFVRGRIEQMFELLERARPMRPGEEAPAAPSTARVPPQRQPGRGYDWSH